MSPASAYRYQHPPRLQSALAGFMFNISALLMLGYISLPGVVWWMGKELPPLWLKWPIFFSISAMFIVATSYTILLPRYHGRWHVWRRIQRRRFNVVYAWFTSPRAILRSTLKVAMCFPGLVFWGITLVPLIFASLALFPAKLIFWKWKGIEKWEFMWLAYVTKRHDARLKRIDARLSRWGL